MSVLVTRAFAARFTGGGALLTGGGGPMFVLLDVDAGVICMFLIEPLSWRMPTAFPRGEGDRESDIAAFGDADRLGIRKCPPDDCVRGEGGAGPAIFRLRGTARGASFGGDLGDVISTRSVDD